MLHLFKDSLLKKQGEKSPAPGWNQTHDLTVNRCVLYHCATTAGQIKSHSVKDEKKIWLTYESSSKDNWNLQNKLRRWLQKSFKETWSQNPLLNQLNVPLIAHKVGFQK